MRPSSPQGRGADTRNRMLRITIFEHAGRGTIDATRMKSVAKAVLAGERVSRARISLAFVDNPTIHRIINASLLDHDEPTDVISFPLSGPGADALEGELIIGTGSPGTEPSTTGTAWRVSSPSTSFTGCCTCAATTTSGRA